MPGLSFLDCPVDSRSHLSRTFLRSPWAASPGPGVQLVPGSYYVGVMDWIAVPSPPLSGPPPAPRGLSGDQPLPGAQGRSAASWIVKTALPAGSPGV